MDSEGQLQQQSFTRLSFVTVSAVTAATVLQNRHHKSHINCFVLLQNIIGLIPLALILGEITEDLAVRFGPTVGGLLNATFGNVVELILSIVALTKGLYTVVASSLVGSILSNLLLVLGKMRAVLLMLHLQLLRLLWCIGCCCWCH